MGHFSTKTPTFWWNRQNCISSVEMYFEEVFLKSFFCYSWAWSKKIWSFVEEIPAGLSNFILGAHRNFLRNNLFFREKVGFFYYFRLLSHFFDGLVITACYVSKYVSRKIIFFSWKRVFYHFRTMSRNFSDGRKIFSARCHKGILDIRKDDFKLKFVRKKNSFPSLSHMEKMIFYPLKEKSKVSQLQATCSWEQFDENFCLKTSCFLSFLDISTLRPFAESFSKPLSIFSLNCPKEHFEEIVFLEKKCFSLVTMSKKLSAIFCRIS